ncbi:hypothetical protein SM124_09110 [Bacillus sp. 31A1R]|uniref:Uncharacterized protein n=1 Tax=Robertmurraya mangrovi TaxID=3098077 RepID=A0ABU5IXM2_9BACI|nr:hypothetical protein [Bacillus sp. 31A1R]MDZ5471905.1 hypothetical protein [Bacillus sp. 31A1R]
MKTTIPVVQKEKDGKATVLTIEEDNEEINNSTAKSAAVTTKKNQEEQEKKNDKNKTALQSKNVHKGKTEKATIKDEEKSLEEIKGKFNSLFSELEAQETSKIDQLVVEAKAEYVSM